MKKKQTTKEKLRMAVHYLKCIAKCDQIMEGDVVWMAREALRMIQEEVK